MIELHLGDCIEKMRTMPDNSVDAVVTDPPYGIDYQSSWKTDKSKRLKKIINDKKPYIWWLSEAFRILKDGGALVCFTRYDTENDFRWAMKLAGFDTKAQIIWDKEIHGMGDLKGDFAPQHENIIFAVKGRFLFPGKRPKSIIRIQRVNAEKLVHPNEKPVSLLEALIESTTQIQQTILDPFTGSGSTGIACKNLNRNFIGIEKDAEYMKIAEKRIHTLKD